MKSKVITLDFYYVQVKLLGLVMSKEEMNTNVTFTLDDGTGRDESMSSDGDTFALKILFWCIFYDLRGFRFSYLALFVGFMML